MATPSGCMSNRQAYVFRFRCIYRLHFIPQGANLESVIRPPALSEQNILDLGEEMKTPNRPEASTNVCLACMATPKRASDPWRRGAAKSLLHSQTWFSLSITVNTFRDLQGLQGVNGFRAIDSVLGKEILAEGICYLCHGLTSQLLWGGGNRIDVPPARKP